MTEINNVAVSNGNGVHKRRRPKHVPKPQPLSRDQLDNRLGAARKFDTLVSSIAADLGGESELSTVQLQLVAAFAGAAITVNDLNARLLLGQEVNLTQQATAISSLVRLASRIGLKRYAKDVTGSLANYLDEQNKQVDHRGKPGADDE